VRVGVADPDDRNAGDGDALGVDRPVPAGHVYLELRQQTRDRVSDLRAVEQHRPGPRSFRRNDPGVAAGVGKTEPFLHPGLERSLRRELPGHAGG
jgi:hypothetical protein